MKTKIIYVVLLAYLVILSFLRWPIRTTEPIDVRLSATTTDSGLSYQQELWINVLEWCESRGVETAINYMDTDGTPSYYSFQFKPETFKSLGVQYGVLEKGLTDAQYNELMKKRELQRSIVSFMIKDKTLDLKTQFPNCVKTFGLPPK